MGNDTPLAVLSEKPQLLYNYFKQLFAQVTNPPVDAIREEIVMAVETAIGPEGNLLEPTPESCAPALPAHPGAAQRGAGEDPRAWTARPASHGFKRHHPAHAVPGARRRRRAAQGGSRTCAGRPRRPSPRGATSSSSPTAATTRSGAPIPALLAVAAVHHHLLREGTRTRVGIVLETGEPREVHHFALLIGYGASAVNPYLAFETLHDQVRMG